MRIDDNAEALAMMKRALGSLEGKIREAYNKGYQDGVKSMVAEDETQTDYRITGTIGYRCPKCGKGNFLSEESNCVYCGEPLIKDEPQTERSE